MSALGVFNQNVKLMGKAPTPYRMNHKPKFNDTSMFDDDSQIQEEVGPNMAGM